MTRGSKAPSCWKLSFRKMRTERWIRNPADRNDGDLLHPDAVNTIRDCATSQLDVDSTSSYSRQNAASFLITSGRRSTKPDCLRSNTTKAHMLGTRSRQPPLQAPRRLFGPFLHAPFFASSHKAVET